MFHEISNAGKYFYESLHFPSLNLISSYLPYIVQILKYELNLHFESTC